MLDDARVWKRLLLPHSNFHYNSLHCYWEENRRALRCLQTAKLHQTVERVSSYRQQLVQLGVTDKDVACLCHQYLDDSMEANANGSGRGQKKGTKGMVTSGGDILSHVCRMYLYGLVWVLALVSSVPSRLIFFPIMVMNDKLQRNANYKIRDLVACKRMAMGTAFWALTCWFSAACVMVYAFSVWHILGWASFDWLYLAFPVIYIPRLFTYTEDVRIWAGKEFSHGWRVWTRHADLVRLRHIRRHLHADVKEGTLRYHPKCRLTL